MNIFTNQFVRVVAHVVNDKFKISTYERASNYCYGTGIKEAKRWANRAELARLERFATMYQVH